MFVAHTAHPINRASRCRILLPGQSADSQHLVVQGDSQEITCNQESGLAPPWHLAFDVHINADVRRTFNALVEPEYIELWLRIPGQEETDRVEVLQTKDVLRIDCYRSEMLDLTIAGKYLTRKRHRIVLNWWSGTWNTTASTLRFYLDGCFGSSVVRLNHRGFFSRNECLWHHEMWLNSLMRFGRLF